MDSLREKDSNRFHGFIVIVYYCLHCMVDSKKDNKVTVWLHQSNT